MATIAPQAAPRVISRPNGTELQRAITAGSGIRPALAEPAAGCVRSSCECTSARPRTQVRTIRTVDADEAAGELIFPNAARCRGGSERGTHSSYPGGRAWDGRAPP